MNKIKTYASDLLEFFHQRYKLQNKPTIIFTQDKQNSLKPFGKTAHYDPTEQSITVYITGRHMKDCLRSLAHELVHHLQNERGDLMSAGPTTPGYAQKDPHMREMEREAYEKGNMCFRDFEDSRKKQLGETNYKDKDTKGEQKMSYKNWRNKEFGEMLMDKWGYKPKEKSFLSEGMGTYDLSNADYKTAQLEEAPEELDEEEKEDALEEAHPMSTEAKEAVLEDLDESALRDAVRDILAEMSKDN
tara:strand:- start:681 stop:1415 length:735 start_codon:yes stop_codon:yes gene_type:complete